MNAFTKSVLLVAFTLAFSNVYAYKFKIYNAEKALKIELDTSYFAVITGTVKTINNQSVKDAIVSLNNQMYINSVNTNYDGSFSISTSFQYYNVRNVVSIGKIANDDKYAGVTTFDIANINKHLVGVDTFTSPIQFLAADINNDREVDISDMLILRNFILRKIAKLPNGTWRFIDKQYQFKDATNPLIESIPDTVLITNNNFTNTVNFLAIKYGDVNNTFVSYLTQPQVRTDKSLNLKVEDMDLVAGNEYTVKITADDFNALAFQGTFSLSDATIKSVKGDLENYGDSNFGLFKNDITTSWNGAATSKTDVLSITFTAEKNTRLSEILTVNSALTPAIANDENGNEMAIKLQFKNSKNRENSFNLLQNTPNPTSFPTNIDFTLPTESPAKLTFFTIDGKVILSKNIDGKIGKNSILIQKSELNNAKGVVFYKLESGGNMATKRMIILE